MEINRGCLLMKLLSGNEFRNRGWLSKNKGPDEVKNTIDNYSYRNFLVMNLKKILVFILIMLESAENFAQDKKLLPPAPVYPLPSVAQMQWHEMELNAFVHFTTNTFTDKEWGYGDESEKVFNPTSLNAEQWAKTLKDAVFKQMILPFKQHDGFCMRQTK